MAVSRYVVTGRVSVAAGTASAPAGAAPTVTTAQTTAAPAGGTAVTSQALAAGSYLVNWSVQLKTAGAAGDANNFVLLNGATQVAASVNAGAVGTYPQAVQIVTIGGGGATVYVNTGAGQGTAGAIYSAVLTTVLLASGGSYGNFDTVGWSGPGSPAAWAQGQAVTFQPGTPLVIDTATVAGAALYAAIGAGNLRAFVDGQDTVGHAAISN